MKQCVVIMVVGKIQNVGYRKYVQTHAKNLNIEGTVQNCEEKNKVQIKACGESEELDAFIDCLYKGTATSKIEEITVEPLYNEKNFREVFRIIGD